MHRTVVEAVAGHLRNSTVMDVGHRIVVEGVEHSWMRVLEIADRSYLVIRSHSH